VFPVAARLDHHADTVADWSPTRVAGNLFKPGGRVSAVPTAHSVCRGME
jgi:hypothetical protein